MSRPKMYRFYCVDCDFAWIDLSTLEFPTSCCEFCEKEFAAENSCDIV